MPSREAVARAIAYFEGCEDAALLRKALAEVAPRARRLVVRYLGAGGPESVPGPAEVSPASSAATKEEALRTLAGTNDFALLQAMTRAMGRRVEELEGRTGPESATMRP